MTHKAVIKAVLYFTQLCVGIFFLVVWAIDIVLT